MSERPPVDLEALLVALVLAPATFSRNRFFSLYADTSARRVRRRAAMLRSLVRQLSTGAERALLAPADHGCALLTFEVPALGLKRSAALEPLELAVVRFAVARGAASPTHEGGRAEEPRAVEAALVSEPGDAAMIERALARLLPEATTPDAAEISVVDDGRDDTDHATDPFVPRELVRHGTQAS